MVYIDGFLEYCKHTLEDDFGKLGSAIIKRAGSKKFLDDGSSLEDIKEFIDIIGHNIILLSGKEKAISICNTLLKEAKKVIDQPEPQNVTLNEDIEKELDSFLPKNNLPVDDDIDDFAKYLSMKYGGDTDNVKKEIIDKVKKNIKDKLTLKKINLEIENFLSRYPEPEKTDVNDFVNFLRLSKMCPDEKKLRDQIEKERLFRKFHGQENEDVVDNPEVDEFFNSIEGLNNEDDINKAMKDQKLSYLIKNDSDVPDPLLNEFIDLMTPDKDDLEATLNGMGLEHMIKQKK